MLLSREKKMQVREAKKLASWFSVSIELKLFGKVIWRWSWPPSNSSNPQNEDDYVE